MRVNNNVSISVFTDYTLGEKVKRVESFTGNKNKNKTEKGERKYIAIEYYRLVERKDLLKKSLEHLFYYLKQCFVVNVDHVRNLYH